MNMELLDESVVEAKRFLRRVRILKARVKKDRWALGGCRETGTVKRSSMDLSRALVQLRKTNNY